VSYAGQKIDDPTANVEIPSKEPAVLKVGKRRVCQIVREG
jgi:hypothetical protein